LVHLRHPFPTEGAMFPNIPNYNVHFGLVAQGVGAERSASLLGVGTLKVTKNKLVEGLSSRVYHNILKLRFLI